MNIKETITTTVCRTKEQMKINAPEILLGLGIGCGVVGIAGTIVATTKIESRLEEIKANQDKVTEIVEADPEALTEEEASRARLGYAIRGYGKIALDYAPALTAYAAAVTCIIKSHNILTQRNQAAIAAFASLDSAFKSYRARVEEKYGVEEERKIRYGVKETFEKEKDPETGKMKKVKIQTIDGDVELGPYVRFFDEASREWTKDANYNALVLKTSQDYWNQALKSRSLNVVGRVFLNEILKELDLPETEEGQYIGWALEKGQEPHIDYGLINYNPAARRFINGYESVALLDFNCDGYVADALPSMADARIEEIIEEKSQAC